MTVPDRIFAWWEYDIDHRTFNRWDDEPNADQKDKFDYAEYIRRDPAVLAVLPEVQELIRQAVEACAQVAHDWQNETGTDIAASARICPQIAAAIRKRGEG